MPAAFQSFSSAMWVPDLSARLAKGACFSPIFFMASSTFIPLIPAGSLLGPRITKSLYMTWRRFTPAPSATNFFSASGSCTSTTSTSPLRPYSRALPVPTETHWISMPVSFWNRGAR